MTVVAGDAAAAMRQGRPRDPHVDEAIRRAAIELLIEEGFARMSIDGVAARAGVGKAAIYRRWDGKTALVVDAIHDRVSCGVEWSSTGDIQADLGEFFAQVLVSKRGVEGELLAALAGEMVRNSELAAAFRAQFVAVRQDEMRGRIRSAMAEGQLAPGDVELLGEVFFAILHNRLLISGMPITEDLPQRIVKQFFPRPAEGSTTAQR
ncbi:MAG: TetR/AcrR family transcriptional regulator [Actinomycetota bacterium]|nr:TetR/AcrR family transcriptional regulator [Actinomycetota bacterium]